MKFTTYLLYLTLLTFSSNSLADSSGYPKTDVDFMYLPPYCKARMRKSSPEDQKQWAKRLGADYLHTHHYCAALHQLRIARSMFPRNKGEKSRKNSTLNGVFNNINYMEQHAKSTYILFPYIYTTKAEAYLEAKKENKAISYFYKAINSNKKFTKPYALLADYYLKHHNKQEAKKILVEGLKYSPQSKALNKRLKKIH